MILFKVSYRVRSHNIDRYEQIFASRVLPLIHEFGLRMVGIWRTVVGNAGEYLELWEFGSLAEFEREWKRLMNDPRLTEVFQSTGPLVEDERFAILEPVYPAKSKREETLV